MRIFPFFVCQFAINTIKVLNYTKYGVKLQQYFN